MFFFSFLLLWNGNRMGEGMMEEHIRIQWEGLLGMFSSFSIFVFCETVVLFSGFGGFCCHLMEYIIPAKNTKSLCQQSDSPFGYQPFS